MQRREFLGRAARFTGAAAAISLPVQALAMEEGIRTGGTAAGVRINQVGYLPRRPKIASVKGQAERFLVRSLKDNSVALRGELGAIRVDEASGDMVRTADFSQLAKPGSYRMELDSGSGSPALAIDSAIYDAPLRTAMRAFYGQRCGCAVNLGGGYQHASCHGKGAFHSSSGRSGAVWNHGGWHDAGDYGRYVVNSGISTGSLLWAWELWGSRLKGLALDIPESGGRIPDFLAEIRWNLNWMLSMQDSDGGVWHKQTSEQFCGFVMPEADGLTSYVIGTGSAPYKSTAATADLAAVTAIAARCYSAYDPSFAQSCLQAARKAWAWASDNRDVTFHNPAGVTTGEYDDDNCKDELLWAAAELWSTTGEAEFGNAFVAPVSAEFNSLTVTAPTWATVTSMAYWSYVLAKRSGSPAIIEKIRQATNAAAESLVTQGDANGYGNTLAMDDYGWGSNSVAANHSLLLLIANQFDPHVNFVNAALDNLHYLLGRNCFGVSWVTHVGSQPFQNPHHRPSIADGIPAPWPGLLSGGPNAKPADPVARRLPRQPPMRMWVDDHGAYSCNEVAINWNAPLVFALAGVDAV